MDCQKYLTRFSEFVDGRADARVSEEMELHRSSCERCREYSDAIRAGGDILRALPELELSPDFLPRLEHRIFHLEDGAALGRESSGSGPTTVSILAVAVLVALSAWAPAFEGGDPTVELPAVVVNEPPQPFFTPPRPSPTFPRNMTLFGTTEFQDGIWGDSHDLLREFSPILERRRNQALIRLGIE